MPVYEYEVVRPDGTPGEVFEVKQRMSDDALTHHPETGEPVRRILSSTFGHSSSGGSSSMGDCGGGACGLGGGPPMGGCCGGGCGLA